MLLAYEAKAGTSSGLTDLAPLDVGTFEALLCSLAACSLEELNEPIRLLQRNLGNLAEGGEFIKYLSLGGTLVGEIACFV